MEEYLCQFRLGPYTQSLVWLDCGSVTIVARLAQLLEEGYPHDAYASDRTIDSHVKRLRKKLAEADPASDAIETVYGLGYRFRPE